MNEPALTPELCISNYEKSMDFYTQLLEFNILYAREEEKFVMLEREGAWIMLEQIGVTRDWITGELDYPYGRGVNFQIKVSDVDSLYSKVKKSDAKIFLEIEEKWYQTDIGKTGNRQFIVQDPDGYLLRFFEDLGIKNEQ